jgi:hypothetical protein
MARPFATSALLLGLAALAPGMARADDAANSHWQARVQLNSLDTRTDSSPRLGGSRLLSANLLGDYYLTTAGVSGLRGGLRATGGMLLGPLSMSQSSAGLALGPGAFSVGQRGLALSGPNADALEASTSLSYLGIGYTGRVQGSGFAFSADLGLMSGGLGNLRLGRTSAQGFEDAMRDLRFKPLLQLGLAYSY